MTYRLSGLAVATGAIALLFALLQLAADRAGWISHGLPFPSESVFAWGLAFLAGWTLMTVAMTLPSLTPFLRAVEAVGGAAAATAAALGVVAIWAGTGLLFWELLWAASGTLATLAPGGVETLASAALLAAALYQASPMARACQRLCAQPFPILARHWRGGGGRRRRAARAGLDYGLSCVGCCLPMIVVMFLVGMSDVRWTLAMAAFMVVQKQPVWGARLAMPAAGALAAAGAAIGLGWWSPDLMSLRALCGA
jgi:predicted metal-binding membrane protein